MIKKLLFFVAFFATLLAKATPGDTTWVQTFSFDEPRQAAWTWKQGTFYFPIDQETQYEKILMYYKIKCDPAQNPACGEWDFLVHTIVRDSIGMTEEGEVDYRSWELGKYITPYGYGTDLGAGWTFIYDVSDFAHLLQDSVILWDMNFQEMIDIRFAFIEGTPVRNLVGIEPIWQRDIYLNVWDDIVNDTTIVLPPNVTQVKLRSTVTGHGFDNPTNCAEFCPKTHVVYANGQEVRSWQIIEECAKNPIYPQGGTWILDRAGWCPGTPGTTVETELTEYIQDQTINFRYGVTSPGNDGYYNVHVELVMYEDNNAANDAAVVAVHAPNNEPIYSRMNPTCSYPYVVIKNTGSENLTSLTLKYGIKNASDGSFHEKQHPWTGNLAFLEMDTVELPIPDWDLITEPVGNFIVELIQPNGTQDNTPHNSMARTNFEMPNKVNWTEFEVYFKTNHRPMETNWAIYNAWGQKTNESPANSELVANTIYETPVTLQGGCYMFKVTDSGHDGLKYWANMSPYGSGTAGSIALNKVAPNGATAAHVRFNADFGAEAQEYFAIQSYVGVEEYVAVNFEVYPNPATEYVTVKCPDFETGDFTVNIYDTFGKLVWSQNDVNTNVLQVPVQGFSNGLYIIECTDHKNVVARKKVAVQR